MVLLMTAMRIAGGQGYLRRGVGIEKTVGRLQTTVLPCMFQ